MGKLITHILKYFGKPIECGWGGEIREKRSSYGVNINNLLMVPLWIELAPGGKKRKKGWESHLTGRWWDFVTGSGGLGTFCYIKKQRSYQQSHKTMRTLPEGSQSYTLIGQRWATEALVRTITETVWTY